MISLFLSVVDLLDANGNLVSYASFTNKFNVTNNFPFFLVYIHYGITTANPTEWKTNARLIERQDGNFITLKLFVNENKLNNTKYNWNNIISLPFTAVRNPKVQHFQYTFKSYCTCFSIINKKKIVCTFCHVQQ